VGIEYGIEVAEEEDKVAVEARLVHEVEQRIHKGLESEDWNRRCNKIRHIKHNTNTLKQEEEKSLNLTHSHTVMTL
jgi:hypothetical protein